MTTKQRPENDDGTEKNTNEGQRREKMRTEEKMIDQKVREREKILGKQENAK